MRSICILLLIVSLGSVLTCNKISLASYEITFNNTESQKQTVKFFYKNLSMAFHTLDEKNISSTIFKLIWEFSSKEESDKAKDVLATLSPVFEESKIDNSGLLLNFFAYHMTALKYMRKSEFGTVYKFEIKQRDKIINVNFMIKKLQDNEPMFEQIINSIFNTKLEFEELKFLA